MFGDNCCTCGACSSRYLAAQHWFSGFYGIPAWQVGDFTGEAAKVIGAQCLPGTSPAGEGWKDLLLSDMITAPFDALRRERYLYVSFVTTGTYIPPNKGNSYRQRAKHYEFWVDKRINRINRVRLTGHEGDLREGTVAISAETATVEYNWSISDAGVESSTGTEALVAFGAVETGWWDVLAEDETDTTHEGTYSASVSTGGRTWNASFLIRNVYDEDLGDYVDVMISHQRQLVLGLRYDDADVFRDTEDLLNSVGFGGTYSVHEESIEVAPVSRVFDYGRNWLVGWTSLVLTATPWPVTKVIVPAGPGPVNKDFDWTLHRMGFMAFSRLLMSDSRDLDEMPEPVAVLSKVGVSFGGTMDVMHYEHKVPRGETAEGVGSQWCEFTGLVDCDRGWNGGVYEFFPGDLPFDFGVGYLALSCRETLPNPDCP